MRKDANILTATRLATLRRCPRQHYYRYELGIARQRPDIAMLFGLAFHAGLSARHRRAEQESAIAAAVETMMTAEEWIDAYDLHYEIQTLIQLLAGYYWRYSADDVQAVDVERVFHVPLRNPYSGYRSRTSVLAGRFDAVVRLSDGRLALMESKTSGEDIGPDSDYWLRLRRDPQILQYAIAAREIGYDVATILYDVTRKPTISPLRATPPEKRKYTRDGRLYASQREYDETPEEFGERLIADIGERPDYYYQRREVPILEDILDDFRLEIWQQAEHMRDARRANRWYRNVSRTTCGSCEYREPCLDGDRLSSHELPAGYHRLDSIHPELEEEQNVSERSTTATTTASAVESEGSSAAETSG